MDEDEIVSVSPDASSETSETVGVSAEVFGQRMDALHEDFTVLAVFLGVIVGCIIAAMVMRWFHND